MSVKLTGPLFDGRMFKHVMQAEQAKVYQAGNMVVRTARQLVPKRTGRLKKSFKFFVTSAAVDKKSTPTFRPRVEELDASKKDTSLHATFASAWYGKFPERGTVKQRAQLFMRRAMEANEKQIMGLFAQGLKEGVAKR